MPYIILLHRLFFKMSLREVFGKSVPNFLKKFSKFVMEKMRGMMKKRKRSLLSEAVLSEVNSSEELNWLQKKMMIQLLEQAERERMLR